MRCCVTYRALEARWCVPWVAEGIKADPKPYSEVGFAETWGKSFQVAGQWGPSQEAQGIRVGADFVGLQGL